MNIIKLKLKKSANLCIALLLSVLGFPFLLNGYDRPQPEYGVREPIQLPRNFNTVRFTKIIKIFGRVLALSNNKPLRNIEISMFDNRGEITKFRSDSSGNFICSFNYSYNLRDSLNIMVNYNQYTKDLKYKELKFGYKLSDIKSDTIIINQDFILDENK
ncbi:MAG: hypothetical protein NT007_16265 [Candidatus Kapabacteria bacterium]|nr:hypothetical protein [Candidatus Kapabacteria bacterium]